MMETVFVSIIVFYQRFVSPLKGRTCRFYPTCSDYAIQSVKKYGIIKGIGKSLIRIAKCHPFHPGGYDPV
ncbi:MAG: membrane protein insertion efficiency factor YidD [Dehalobacter sp. 4CP]|uniref:membrane protein insertion efficiency factor YidD n=1 Tax=unclassified Dehalobacter TaxID=2635733 RepID=UPI001A99147A|nr:MULTISPECIES: membrane protein insertion efficiency factor YidD [unclassified Dehalobacter]MCM1565998.1 membrane protein insertion efficiency factor YidD [Dehalobacter sp.]